MNSGFRFIRFGPIGQNIGRAIGGGAWWLLLAPRLLLTLMALAILVWPELLAYMVASVILFAGLTLIGWSLTMRMAEKKIRRNISGAEPEFNTYRSAQGDVIYYER